MDGFACPPVSARAEAATAEGRYAPTADANCDTVDRESDASFFTRPDAPATARARRSTCAD